MSTPTAVDVVMPQMGVSVSEGTITKWLKQEGEEIQADEALLEISTDKVDTEVPSPGTGVVQQILVQEGETVDVGTRLAVIGAPGAAEAEAPPGEEEAPQQATTEAAAEAATASSAETPAPAAPAEPAPEPEPMAIPTPAAQQEPTAAPSAQPEPMPAPEPAAQPEPMPAPEPAAQPEPIDVSGDGKSFISPVVARIASEHNVDVSQVPGTGRGGRVTKKDILAFVEGGDQAAAAPAAPPAPEPEAPAAPEPEPAPEPAPAAAAPPPPPPTPAPAPAPAPAPQPQVAAGAGESEEPMSAMRKGIAEHMRRSLDTSAHVTSAIEVDMSRVV